MKETEEKDNERSSWHNFLKKVGIGVGAVSIAAVLGHYLFVIISLITIKRRTDSQELITD
ncbi:MAG TPA: hypothetical protein VMV77_01455 [Bacteroidales bacterium]|nr:hypothetical protein [Bacteroidales bacterium]